MGLGSSRWGAALFSSPVWLDDTSPDAKPDGVIVVKVLLDDVEKLGRAGRRAVRHRQRQHHLYGQPRAHERSLSAGDEQRDALRETRRYAMEPLTPSGLLIPMQTVVTW